MKKTSLETAYIAVIAIRKDEVQLYGKGLEFTAWNSNGSYIYTVYDN